MSFYKDKFEENFGKISEHIPICTLEEICPKEKGNIISGPFGSNISSKFFVEKGVPVIRGNNLSLEMDKFIDDGFVFVTTEKAESLNTFACIDDLIFTAAGTIGQVGLITKQCKYEQYIISNKQLRATVDKNKVLPLYAYFWFSCKKMQDYIVLQNTGSTIPLINLKVLRALPIPLPSIEIQKKIVSILNSIDKKIEINRHINRNLSEQAMALYKEMILDASDDCSEGVLSDIADIIMGQSPKGDTYNEDGEGVVFYQGRAEFGDRFPTRRLFTTDPKRMAKENSVLMSVRAPVGDVNVAYEECCIGRGLCSVDSKDNHQSFVLYTMYSLKEQFDVYNGEGTVFGSINKDSMNRMDILIPKKEVMDKFEEIVSPIDAMIKANYDENCRLVEIRDSLLPKLMSGELDISEVDI